VNSHPRSNQATDDVSGDVNSLQDINRMKRFIPPFILLMPWSIRRLPDKAENEVAFFIS